MFEARVSAKPESFSLQIYEVKKNNKLNYTILIAKFTFKHHKVLLLSKIMNL